MRRDKRERNPYELTEQDFEVKEKIGILLELLGEDFEIILSINGYLDLPASDALRVLNYRIHELQKKTGNYGPYLAEPVDLNSNNALLLMDKVGSQMEKKGYKIICKRKNNSDKNLN